MRTAVYKAKPIAGQTPIPALFHEMFGTATTAGGRRYYLRLENGSGDTTPTERATL
jgi:hypothetical protein